MKTETWHWEIRSILSQFEDAFNDIVIRRYNVDKEAKDKIHVNFRYSPKTRALHEIRNKNQHFKLPIVAISLGGMRRNSARVFNKIDGSYWRDTATPTTSAWIHLLQPVPIDVTVNMSIIARYQLDVDQILTNFIPFCNPYIVVSWKWPYIIPFADFEIRSHIHWNEDVSFNYPLEIAANIPYRAIADTSFTIEGWLFRNQPDDGKPIYVVDTQFSAMSSIESFEVMQDNVTTDNTDYYTDYTVISARPQFTLCDPLVLYEGVFRNVALYGRMLDYTDRIYLSAADFSIFNSVTTHPGFNGVIAVNSMSGTRFDTAFPEFTGLLVPSAYWNVLSENIISLSSLPVSAGNFDVIAWNKAGYGLLTLDSVRPTFNPYPTTLPEYATYTEFQYSCVSGIEVRAL